MASSGEISNGGEAMNAFLAFATMSSEQIAKKHKELLAYCELIQNPKVWLKTKISWSFMLL